MNSENMKAQGPKQEITVDKVEKDNLLCFDATENDCGYRIKLFYEDRKGDQVDLKITFALLDDIYDPNLAFGNIHVETPETSSYYEAGPGDTAGRAKISIHGNFEVHSFMPLLFKTVDALKNHFEKNRGQENGQ